jgi:hypothetical protein
VREWPAEFQVSLGAIGGHFSFTKAELDSLTLREMGFWLASMSEYLKKVKAAQR